MIFRRTKKRSDERDPADDVTSPDAEVDADADLDADDAGAEDTGTEDAAGAGDEAPVDEAPVDEADALDVDELDAQDWRDEGPLDIAELDDPEDLDGSPDLPRIDLGAMVLTGFPGAELRLQMAEDTQQIVSAMLIHRGSALELGAYAAPRSGGLWSELREEIMAGALEAGGTASLAEGPFGVELRRLIPVTTPEGEQGYQPSRMWVAEGPRWLLRGIVYGEAALEDSATTTVAEMASAFRQVIVRRGDEAMAPGDLLPLTMPQNLAAADEQPA